jgi:hypothetical protein
MLKKIRLCKIARPIERIREIKSMIMTYDVSFTQEFFCLKTRNLVINYKVILKLHDLFTVLF